MIGDFRLINPGYTFKITFGFANGVKKSAPVRLSGVEMGEVREIEFSYDDKTKKSFVIIEVWVKREAKIPIYSRCWVNMLGLLGEKYIEIMPGQNYGHLLNDGSVIVGEDPIAIQELTDLSRQIAEQVGTTVEEVSITLGKLNTTLDSINSILANVKQGEGTVGKLFYDDSLYNNIEEMFGDLKEHPWKLLYRPKGK
jgi:phospholipid/cholesterol/gamma-HCH transport system substrate-binding protein